MTDHASPLVSIVILNWNRLDDTLECLASVRKINYPNFETIVVDNGSTDGSKQKLATIDNITLVDNLRNRGFTGGHIDGLQSANGDFIFILNNDAVVDPNCLKYAVERMQADDAIAAVAGRAYKWNSSEPAHNPRNSFYAYANINPVSAEAIFSQSDNNTAMVVNSVSGSATLIRRSVIDKIGYFYNPYFAYYEETDLFARMKRTGHKIVYDPKVWIWHKDGSSSSSYFRYHQLFKNRLIFGLRNFDRNYLLSFIKSYIKVGLRCTYMRFRPSDDPQLHRAFSNAFLRSCLVWPIYVVSRWRLGWSLRRITKGHVQSYNQALIAENVGLSVVVDLSQSSQSKIASTIRHYESLFSQLEATDIVLCLPSKPIKTKLRTVRINKNFSNTSLNIGWLSTSQQFVLFSNQLLSLADLQAQLQTARQLSINRAWLNPNNAWSPIDRELLIHSGGLADNKLSDNTYRRLAVFAVTWGKHKVLAKVSHSILPASDRRAIVEAVHSAKFQDKKPTAWENILTRHYRIYQVRNIAKWLVSTKISLRLKLARTKNLMLFALTLKRQDFATELKHIRNEVIKSSRLGKNIEHLNKASMASLEHFAHKLNWQQLPVFIICRDRLDSMEILVKWLEKIGLTNIVFIDNDSIYPRLVEYFRSTPYQVIATNTNIGHTVPWAGGIIRSLVPNSPYIVTDPDVIPDSKCPDNVIEHFIKLHIKYFDYQKVGFGLQIDDLPNHFKLRQSVIDWEAQFWEQELEPNVFEAGVDTTFAVYKPYTFSYFIHPSIRTGSPYVARHLPWYIDSLKISPEEEFYRQRLNKNVTSWNVTELDDRYLKELSKKK